MVKTFAHHTPDQACVGKVKEMRVAFSELHLLIERLAPASRERSVALTNLETTAMWAIKALVVNDPNSVQEA